MDSQQEDSRPSSKYNKHHGKQSATESLSTVSVSLALLDDVARNFEKQDNILEGMKFREKALLLRKELFGADSNEVEMAVEKFVVKCNLFAMKYLKEGMEICKNFDHYLK